MGPSASAISSSSLSKPSSTSNDSVTFEIKELRTSYAYSSYSYTTLPGNPFCSEVARLEEPSCSHATPSGDSFCSQATPPEDLSYSCTTLSSITYSPRYASRALLSWLSVVCELRLAFMDHWLSSPKACLHTHQKRPHAPTILDGCSQMNGGSDACAQKGRHASNPTHKSCLPRTMRHSWASLLHSANY